MLTKAQYCNRACQQKHWAAHKTDCKSPLRKETWLPGWETNNRLPNFIGDGPSIVSHGTRKYFWGNVPALDILRLSEHEGETYGQDLVLLFAGQHTECVHDDVLLTSSSFRRSEKHHQVHRCHPRNIQQLDPRHCQ